MSKSCAIMRGSSPPVSPGNTTRPWGGVNIQYNTKYDALQGTLPSAANSHWRDAICFTIVGFNWAGMGLAQVNVEQGNRKFNEEWMRKLREFGPGAYGNEGDVMEPNLAEAFFRRNYERLVEIKRKVDPIEVFWATTG